MCVQGVDVQHTVPRIVPEAVTYCATPSGTVTSTVTASLTGSLMGLISLSIERSCCCRCANAARSDGTGPDTAPSRQLPPAVAAEATFVVASALCFDDVATGGARSSGRSGRRSRGGSTEEDRSSDTFRDPRGYPCGQDCVRSGGGTSRSAPLSLSMAVPGTVESGDPTATTNEEDWSPGSSCLMPAGPSVAMVVSEAKAAKPPPPVAVIRLLLPATEGVAGGIWKSVGMPPRAPEGLPQGDKSTVMHSWVMPPSIVVPHCVPTASPLAPPQGAKHLPKADRTELPCTHKMKTVCGTGHGKGGTPLPASPLSWAGIVVPICKGEKEKELYHQLQGWSWFWQCRKYGAVLGFVHNMYCWDIRIVFSSHHHLLVEPLVP